MKTYWIKPGFEFIFALSLTVIMILPPLVFAQGSREMEIKITNEDTTINGKNIKALSADERKQALKDIDNLGSISKPEGLGQHHHQKKGLADTGSERIIVEDRHFRNGEMMGMRGLDKDTTGRISKFRLKRFNGKDSTYTFNYRFNPDREDRFENRDFDFPTRDREIRSYRHRNVQRFEYTNTGSDGISTYMSFRVSEASPEKIKAITGSEKAELEIKDLNIVPEFSSGKTLLMFSLPVKTVAEVKLTDSEGKLIWSDKAMNGSFNKSFALGLNGIYFLQIKQAGKIALKRIMKEE